MAASCHQHLARRAPPARCLFVILPPLLVLTVLCLLVLGSQLSEEWLSYQPFRLPSPFSLSEPSYAVSSSSSSIQSANRSSPFSFDLTASQRPAWMAAVPNDWPLARLALPGTHDTLTQRIPDVVYLCQNSGLAEQLRAGVRYLDVRTRVQIPDSTNGNASSTWPDDQPWPLGIYHADMYTGYELAEVVTTVFSFLDENPSETVVLRLKEEAKPVLGSVDDAPGRRDQAAPKNGTDWWQLGTAAQTQPSPYEASFNWYRLHDPRTAQGFAEHLYRFPAGDDASSSSSSSSFLPPTSLPTMNEARGKVVLLQEFPYFPESYQTPGTKTAFFGVPWDLSSALLQVEDLYAIADLAHLEDKWVAIRGNLQAAAKAAARADNASTPLFLSHLSASVGVLPVDAAAGPEDGSVVGMNDRTGQWLVAQQDADDPGSQLPVGIVIADFPGQQLIEAVLKQNTFS